MSRTVVQTPDGRSVRAFVTLCEGTCIDFNVVVVNP